MIISYAKRVKEFSDIKEVSIFRYDKLYNFSKNFDKKLYDEFTSPFSKEEKEEIKPFFEERSHGIFENNVQDEQLHKKFEAIREIIKNS